MSTKEAMRTGRSCLLLIGTSNYAFDVFLALTRVRGESGLGKWSVVVRDTNVNDFSGDFTDWRITLWGESMDGSKQKMLPLPTDHDDDDHDTIPANVDTTTLPIDSMQTDLPAQPSDHIDRPVNARPTATTSTSQTSSTSVIMTSSTPTAISDSTPTPTPTFFLPSIFPTFGVSPRTQIWIYGAAVTIVLFCIALGAFFYVWRRRRRTRINGADYEFEILDDHDAAADVPLNAGGRRIKKRAGELYDAFAGESDEEILSETEEGYKDEEPEMEKQKRNRSPDQTSEK